MIVGNVQHCCSSSLAAHTGPRLRPLLLLFLPFSGVRICRLYINQKWKVYACNCENAKIPLFSSFACLLDDARARAFCAPFVRYSEQQTFNGKMDMLQQQHNFTLEIKMAPNQVAMQLCKLFVRLCFFSTRRCSYLPTLNMNHDHFYLYRNARSLFHFFFSLRLNP